jgi:predicted ATPase/DNA-binding XRE family transcriptional regulator
LAEVSFGEWLRRQRKARGLTQEQLALQISCSTSALKKIEAEERHPSTQIVEQLAEIFDIPPDERKAFLHFARGDWQSAPTEIKQWLPWHPSTDSPASNLPARLTSLIGREKEITNVFEYLSKEDIRLVTLIGPPGIGKTRLSTEVARAALSGFPGGVFFIALAPLDDPNLIAPTICQTLGLLEAIDPFPLSRLEKGIGDRKLLLVLDNVEHLIEEAATLVSHLLPACPGLKILATSREALRVLGEWVYSVPPLKVPQVNSFIAMETVSQFSALTLFAERARAARSDFVLNANNIKTVALICARLDGLPLAIELIAARARFMSPQTLLTKLNDPFVFSADDVRALSARQKTLHNAISWSYNLLTEPERILFRRLGIFVGGFTFDAAKAVCGLGELDGKDIFDLLGRLIDKSLVVVEGVSTRNETRYSLLETIREYTFAKLNQSEEVTSVCLRHLSFFAEMVEEAERNFKGALRAGWYHRLDRELDNLRAALTWFEGTNYAEIRLRFAAGLWRYWKSRGQSSEGRRHLQRTLESLPPGPTRQTAACARALSAAGSLAYYEGDLSYSEQSRQEALAIFRNLGDTVGIADCLNGLGNTAISQGNYDAARGFYEESLTMRRDLGDTWGVARLLGNLGLLAYFQMDYAQAYSLHSESLTLFRELRDDESIANELVNLGDVALHQAELSSALAFYKESAAISGGLKDQWGFAYAIMGIANVDFEQGDFSKASSLYRECLSIFLEDADQIGLPYALESVAALAVMKNQPEKAARIFGAADALRKSTNSPMPLPNSSAYQKNISVLQQQLAPSKFEAMWREGQAMTMKQAVAYVLENQE